MALSAPGDGVLTKWSVHLTLFFFMFGMMLQQFVGQNMILYKICINEHDEDTCKDMSSHPTVQDGVQVEASKFIMLQMISLGLPSAFSTLILGAASDQFGRRKIMLLTSFGVTLFTLSVWYQSTLAEMSQVLVILGGLATGVTGGIMSFIGTVTNYITDVTPAEERTATLSTVFPFMGIGAMVGTLSAGFLESTFGFQVVLLFSFCAELIALLFVAFFVKDVLPPKKDGQTKSILSEIKSGASVLFQNNTGNRKRLLPLLFSDVVNMAFIMCEGSLMMLYTNRPPFNWTSNAFGFYAAAKQVAGVLGQVFGTGIIIKFIGTQNIRTDFTILQIGVSMNIVVALITAFSNSSVMLLLAIPFCFLAGPAQSAGGSLTSKLVSSDKKGSYTAFTSFITTFLAPMISSFYNQLYSSSVTSGNPGLVFIIHASALMAVVLLLRFGKQGLEDDKTYKQEQGKGKGKVI